MLLDSSSSHRSGELQNTGAGTDYGELPREGRKGQPRRPAERAWVELDEVVGVNASFRDTESCRVGSPEKSRSAASAQFRGGPPQQTLHFWECRRTITAPLLAR